MFVNMSEYKFYIKPGHVDFRKAINGLAVIVQNDMKLQPFSKSLFLFCSRTKKQIKILYWDKNGFCLWQKKLEKQCFPWPGNSEQARQISQEQMKMLLEGIDFFNAHKELTYTRV